MNYMICRHKVENFDTWYQVFSSHEQAQRDAGLELLHLLRSVDDPDEVVMFFRVADLGRARAFTSAPDAAAAGAASGVLGEPEIRLLSDFSGA